MKIIPKLLANTKIQTKCLGMWKVIMQLVLKYLKLIKR